MICKECNKKDTFISKLWEDRWIKKYGKLCYYCALLEGWVK